MDPTIAKQLVDKMYERRKAAALDLEKLVRECHQQGDERRIGQIVDQLIDMFSSITNALHVRNGGLIGLAGTAIALGVDIAPYMERFLEALLVCFSDPENRVRYFAAECLYNVAKVSKGEVLVYFNPIFDALIVRQNGAELLDRLLKDIVAESASYYVPHFPETEKRRAADNDNGIVVPTSMTTAQARRRIELSPFTRSFLVSWISVLDSVPELELITYLPHLLDGLLKYLSDPTEDVRIVAENLLAEFLREIREVTIVRKHREEQQRLRESEPEEQNRTDVERIKERSPDIATLSETERASFLNGDSTLAPPAEGEKPNGDVESEVNERDVGDWVPGQGVRIDYAAIIEILIQQLDAQHDEIQQGHGAIHPRLIPAILPNLAHHVPMIQSSANRTNKLLLSVIQSLPSPSEPPSRQSTLPSERTAPVVARGPSASPSLSRPSRESGSVESLTDSTATPTPSNIAIQKRASLQAQADGTQPPRLLAPLDSQLPARSPTPRPPSPQSLGSVAGPASVPEHEVSADTFDYQSTVNALTIQFLSEHEETRVAALKWLIMLHQKAPKKILAMDDGTFPALLKTLSDTSEEKAARYTRSLIIRQLCLNLSTERIYKAFAEILEKEEDLDFASVIVQKLSTILITSPELADFRRRLKSLETRQDGQALFVTLYRSWCHNAVAVFSLCLLAQAYEHASNLLGILRVSPSLIPAADLEMTVQILVQIDKLVQLIESPVFTYIRLQLLEPDRYPYLFKCLYGLLMLLPQSSAFISLRNRLNAVNSAGFLHIAPKPSTVATVATRSKLARDEIKWPELLAHFRVVQTRHERARRAALGSAPDISATLPSSALPERPAPRRRVTGLGEVPGPPGPSSLSSSTASNGRPGALSPLNPRARVQGGVATTLTAQGQVLGARPKRGLSLVRKA
ncbi:vacuolar protein 14 C-terminal Fig4p binding-domain-containing protein [Multifurca ochricompacta]|uniref:Vacuolar protein 14 C-terminal Fig4p binding-domain-containing protein n=1 Tax=Multifurca ochricompacta TaxID=376703 RepID=A0AAD4LYG3_9AGAM|nr:vacuolar protein 14 C-terminal Fig4p binding-domain-containing protein [Multifurca ochricompacta]